MPQTWGGPCNHASSPRTPADQQRPNGACPPAPLPSASSVLGAWVWAAAGRKAGGHVQACKGQRVSIGFRALHAFGIVMCHFFASNDLQYCPWLVPSAMQGEGACFCLPVGAGASCVLSLCRISSGAAAVGAAAARGGASCFRRWCWSSLGYTCPLSSVQAALFSFPRGGASSGPSPAHHHQTSAAPHFAAEGRRAPQSCHA